MDICTLYGFTASSGVQPNSTAPDISLESSTEASSTPNSAQQHAGNDVHGLTHIETGLTGTRPHSALVDQDDSPGTNTAETTN